MLIIFQLCNCAENISLNHKNYNFLDSEWFEKLTFSVSSLAQVVIGQFVIGQFIHASVLIIFQLCNCAENISLNHKNYNFLDSEWFKKLTFSVSSLAQVVIRQFVIGQFNKQITFRILVFMNQSHSKL